MVSRAAGIRVHGPHMLAVAQSSPHPLTHSSPHSRSRRSSPLSHTSIPTHSRSRASCPPPRYIDLRIKAAAAREVQTELAQRVSTWRQRIDPVLKAEEGKRTFDLQQYGERILGTLISQVRD